MVSLQAGKNTIRIESDAPYYPMVDAVRITQLEKDLLIENKGYNTFIAWLKSSSFRRVLPAEKETQEEIDRKTIEQNDMPQLRSAQYPDSYDWQVTPTTFSCPECSYNHKMNVPITFTYYRKLSLSAGNYTFNTAPISGDDYYSVDPVMYLYKINDPHNYSWCNDDYNSSSTGRHSWINVSNIPAGDYYLVVRAFSGYHASNSLGRQGLVNVYQNGILLNSNAPVAGYMFDVSSSKTGLLNYFTAYSTGIPIIWLIENNSSGVNYTKMKFKGETYSYINPSDYYWFDDARIQLTKNSSATYSMLVSAEGAMSFNFGNCDAYGSTSSGSNTNNFGGAFPNLKSGDCMISAPATNAYNCASWAGGRTDLGRYFWASDAPGGTNLSSPWYVAGDYWQSWDNFFGNNPARSSTATTYSRTPNGQAEVSLWTGGHAAVRLDGNLQPHGYDWESKCGGYARMFHPESAFQGSGYGVVSQYYYPVSPVTTYSSPSIPFEEELSLGLTVLQNVKLNDEEKSFIKQMILPQSSQLKQTESTYKNLLDAFISKINSSAYMHISNPEVLFGLEEYKKLKAYCKANMDNLFYHIIDDSFSDDDLTAETMSGLFVDLTYDSNKSVLEGVKKSWAQKCYTSKGEYLAPSPIANRKNYIKKILGKQVNPMNVEEQTLEERLIDNNDIFVVAPNPVTSLSYIKFTLPQDARVTITLSGVQDAISYIIINDKQYSKGSYEIPLNADRLQKNSLYVCNLILNNTKLSRKILVK